MNKKLEFMESICQVNELDILEGIERAEMDIKMGRVRSQEELEKESEEW